MPIASSSADWKIISEDHGSRLLWNVSSAGDINGDGYVDIIIGAPQAGNLGGANAGEAYVIFGKASGFGTLDVASMSAADGFTIFGGLSDYAGYSVSSAGDFNGDGFDDLIVGAPFDSYGSLGGGGAYIVFGKAGGFSNVGLFGSSSPDWVRIKGDTTPGLEGYSVSTAGDVNGDGFDDVIVGAPYAADGGSLKAGKAYVIFGKAGGFENAIDVHNLSLAGGFTIVGGEATDQAGFSVSSAGDVNGDGFDDLIIGAPYSDGDDGGSAGKAYVIFGKSGGFATIDLASLAPADGFIILGENFGDRAGESVSSAGDVNGDGFDDLIVGAQRGDDGVYDTGEAYVIFGKADGFATIDLTTLGSADGFVIRGHGVSDWVGDSVSSAGDVNGDGFDDVIVGGPNGYLASPGRAYVVYGKAGGFHTIDVATLSPEEGFTIEAGRNGSRLGDSVSSGDVNGDGFSDIMIGESRSTSSGDPAAYVFLGAIPTTDVLRTGSIIGQTINGGSGNDFLDGREGDDRLIARAGDDQLIGGSGNDTLLGGDGTDELSGGLGNDSLSGEDGDDTITGGTGDDLISGGAGLDQLLGQDGNDRLDGGLGADVMLGGLGNDSYVIDEADDFAFEASNAGVDTVESAISLVLGANLERLILTGTAAINGTGNGLANIITGNSGTNRLDGGTGADTMNGGLGSDTYIVENVGDVVLETSAAGGTDSVESSATFILGSNIENLTLTGANAINGTGNASANGLVGNIAANILNGGAGADTMTGGLGNDTYVIDNVGDVVIEAAGGGTDTIQTSTSHTLATELENLTLTGTGNVNGTGNGVVNVLIGNSGANQLDGGAGADTMQGGLGNDSYFVDNGLDKVIEAAGGGTDTVNSSITHQLAAEVENLILTGVAAINGFGNGLANTLTGNGAANRLDGGLGADTLKGGLGDDIYIVDQAGDIVSELAGQGTDKVESAVSYTLAAAVENLTLTGSGDINGTGNLFANTLIGTSGANRLDGGGGADTMNGGLGNDTYVVDNVGDVVIESSATGGIDTVESAITFVLGPTLENLFLAGVNAINGTGNALGNMIVGNGAANILNGMAGDDSLFGRLGNDTIVTGSGTDFVFFDTALNAANNVDAITDLAVASDTLFLDHTVFTGIAAGILAAGAFQLGATALDADDRILYDSATGRIFYDSDGTGAATQILFATVAAGTALTQGDFFIY